MPDVNLPTGVRLHYEVVGEGEPLVLIPGTGQGGRLWALQVPAYREQYRCILVDNRGAGQSDVPDDGYTTRQMAADVEALLAHLGIARAHVSGQSMGSAVGQELAINWPQRVVSLQLHSTWDQTAQYPHFRRQLLFRRELARREEWGLFAQISTLWLFPAAYANDHGDELERQEALLFANHATSRGLVGHYDADLAHDATGRLGRIRAPTLVTYGTEDLATLPAYNLRVHQAIPGAELAAFEGAGHLTFRELPDDFNRVSLDFLDRHRIAG
jgi:pimeloyl-ACP methyl ester carboxylesterase